MKTDERFRIGRTAALSLAVILAAFSPVATSAQERGEMGIALGEHPELVEIEDLDGNKVSLADYVGGRPSLIEFWARWCELCEALHPQMVEAELLENQFVGVAVDADAGIGDGDR